MTLFLYNTLTRKKESFAPISESDVRIYCCGPTVYDSAHIGNCRAFVLFDLLVRVLRDIYPKVTAVRNITDIDDKIILRAKEAGISITDLTEHTIAAFHEDMEALGVLPPTHEPRATDYVPCMQEMIQGLITKGHAYEAEGHVLFETQTAPHYGQLSRMDRAGQIEGARVEIAPYKRDPSDFVLWKPSSPDVIGWNSPWGRGRPGWHIECSAMSRSLLGETFDIHAGGLDLIFPHHENEMAQSFCCHGHIQSHTWVHNGFLMVDGEKMSKSLGNFHTARSLIAGEAMPAVRGETLRAFLLSSHYRAPFDFTKSGLLQARVNLDKWYGILRDAGINEACSNSNTVPPTQEMYTALRDDLNTARAYGELHRLATLARSQQRDEQAFRQAALTLRASANLMGLLEAQPQDWFQAQSTSGGASLSEIEAYIEQRNAARLAKDFTTSDKIRDKLEAMGVLLEDGPNGTSWRRS